jgi:3-hydroxyacyl-CoA dehydrogenase/enoyl-CoA hydratase/3-hydroxybutyryl-CoA epimerase
MSIQESLRIRAVGDIAIMEWDLVGEKVNKMSAPILIRLRELLEEVQQSKYKALIMISKKPGIFIAGADIEEIRSLKKKEDFEKALTEAHQILNKIEDLKIPVIAAIHGQCLGGGCELSLACDYRIATDDNSTRIGLPEVKLGIIPGFGGCVRLPRVVGLQASLDIILAGKSVDANKALKIGLVDQVVHPNFLEERALQLANEVASKPKRKKRFKPEKPMDRVLESAVGQFLVYRQARKTVMEQTHGHYPAPLKALEVIQKTYGFSRRDEAIETEKKAFCEVATTEISKHLINVFFLMESVKKKSGVADNAKPKKVSKIAVLGAGTMGGGIAYVAADRGIEARLKDINTDALARGFVAAQDILGKLLKKRKINKYDYQRKMDLISGTTDYSGFKLVDVVIEAIVEDMKIKQKVIAEVAGQCRPDCIIATNTSSLSVTEMAKAHPHPENFVGMHFFNPVHKMPLVEVIRGEKTSSEATATIFELSKKLGKIPVVVKDGPGFLVNRLLMPYLIEAAFMLEEGVSADKVDEIYVQEFGMPMGPFTLMDEIGIDVCAKVVKIFHESFGDRLQTPEVMHKLVEKKRLGRKTLKGFYLYDERGKRGDIDPSVYADIGLKNPTDPLNNKDIVQRGIFAMINEAALALIEEHIVDTPEEVDLAMIMGTGFPPFRGGLLRYADSVGTAYIVDELEIYASRLGERFKPSVPLRNMAKTKRSFY